jgi:thioredoxin 1
VKLRNLAKDTDLGEGLKAIKFFATWCGPCKLYAPVFERASAQHPEVEFFEFDVDTDPEIREDFGVVTVPTTVLLKNGAEASRVTGAISSRMLDNFLDGR